LNRAATPGVVPFGFDQATGFALLKRQRCGPSAVWPQSICDFVKRQSRIGHKY
jgi:hypothetical protein